MFRGLKSLAIVKCNKFEFLPRAIEDLRYLTRLDLSWSILHFLPEEVCLPSLKQLILRHTLIATLPAAIGKLSELALLDLRGCSRLHSLPEGVANLCALARLNMAYTQMKTLPPEVCGLTQLRDLNLSKSNIQELPRNIGWVNLTSLALSGCSRLKSLPDSIGSLAQLKNLDLCMCPLTRLPDVFERMINLETLSVLYCVHLAELPPSLYASKSLREVILHGTRFQICVFDKGVEVCT